MADKKIEELKETVKEKVEEAVEELSFDDLEEVAGGSMRNAVKSKTGDITSSIKSRI